MKVGKEQNEILSKQQRDLMKTFRSPYFTYLVVVRSSIRAGTDTAETPCINKTIEAVIVAIFKKEWHDQALKHTWL